MPADPHPAFCWKLNLNGQTAGFLSTVDFPTETSMTFDVSGKMTGMVYDWIFQTLQGQRRMLGGTLITLDTTLKPVYCDAWDSGWIQQMVLAPLDASQAKPMVFSLTLQISNLREVPLPQAGGGAAVQPASKSLLRGTTQRFQRQRFRVASVATGGSRRDADLNCAAFKVTMNGSQNACFVKKLGKLTVNASSISPLVMTMVESAATDFRAWKQAGGQRDVTILCLNTALRSFFSVTCSGSTIAQIHPPVPINPTGATDVTLNVSRLAMNFVT